MEVSASHLRARYPTHTTLETTKSPFWPSLTGLSPSLAWAFTPKFRYANEGVKWSKLHISHMFPYGIRFALCGFRSPLLTASLLISFPPGTKMFQLPGFPFLYGTNAVCVQEVLFGYLRILGSMRLPGAYRSLARPSSAPKPSHPPDGGVATLWSVLVQLHMLWHHRPSSPLPEVGPNHFPNEFLYSLGASDSC